MGMKNNFKRLLIEKMGRDNEQISQAEVARAIGVSPESVSNWVHQETHPFQHLEAVCRYLACSPEQLFEFDPPIEILSRLGRDKNS